MRQGQLIRSGATIAAAVACAVSMGVPAMASAGRADRPAGHGVLTLGYRVVTTIRVGGMPVAIAEDPLTDTTYVADEGARFSTAVINDHTGKAVASLPVFAHTFAFDSRTDAFYLPAPPGVVVIAGRTHQVIARLPLDASLITVDPRTGHVYLATPNGSILVLSDRTNKIIARMHLPAFTRIGPMAARPARGVIYVGITPSQSQPAVLVIGTRSGKVLARIGISDDPEAFAVDERNNVLSVLEQSSLTMIDGRKHMVRAVVNVLQGIPEAGADAVAVIPGTHTVYASAECDPDGWVSAVSERTGGIVATISGEGLFRSLGVDRSRDVVFAVDNAGDNVLVIDTRTNKVISTLAVGVRPDAVAVNPVTGRVYVANFASRTVSVLAPTGVSARQAGGSVGATGRTTVGHAIGVPRGVCG